MHRTRLITTAHTQTVLIVHTPTQIMSLTTKPVTNAYDVQTLRPVYNATTMGTRATQKIQIFGIQGK
jgi:hypothetical protein